MLEPLAVPPPRGPIAAQGLSYAMIGGLALGVDVGLFAVVHEGIGVPAIAANAVSTAAAVVFSFLANAVRTFGVTDAMLRRFLSFALVAGLGFLISATALWVFALQLGWRALWVKIAVLPLVAAVQFLLNRRTTFAIASRPRHGSTTTATSRAASEGSAATRLDVAVVGGGFTGLTAAYELARNGHRVELYEAAPHVGGLAAGFTLDDGFPLERAYHFAYSTDRFLLAMARELGVADRLHFHPSTITAFVDGVPFPLTSAMDLLKFRPLALIDRVRTGLTCVALMAIRDWRPLSGVTAYRWLLRVNGPRATDLLWKPLLIGKFDTAWDRVSMAWLWARIRVRHTSRVPGDRREHLGYFTGGFGVLVDRWIHWLDQMGVPIHTNTPIQAMAEAGGRPVLSLADGEVSYDAVLVTLPGPVFARAAASHPQMSDGYAERLNGVDYLAAVVMIIVSGQPLTDTYWHQIHDEDAPFLVVLSLDALIGPEATGGRHIYYIGDYVDPADPLLNTSDQELREHWFPALGRLFPSFDANLVRECHVFRFRNAQHIVDVNYQNTIPSLQTPLDGYYLANFAQIFPDDRGTNFAIRDGLAAAHAITQRTPDPPAAPGVPEPREGHRWGLWRLGFGGSLRSE